MSPRRYAARKPILGLDRRAERERPRSNHVDLTCTLPMGEHKRETPTEELPGMGSKAYSAAQQQQGTKSVSQRPRAVRDASVKSHRRGSL